MARISFERLNILTNQLFKLYVAFFTVRTALLFSLQCVHTHLKQELNFPTRSLTVASKSRLEKQINLVYGLMLGAGSVHRELGTAGIFCYAVYLFLPLVYYSVAPMYLQRSASKGFCLFLANPVQSSELISASIERCLRETISSNTNYIRAILSLRSNLVRPANHKPPDASKDQATKTTGVPDQPPPPPPPHYSSWQPHILHGRHQSLRERQAKAKDVYRDPHDCSIQYLFLQNDHLNSLIHDKGPIWPPNRSPAWQTTMRRWWLRCYIGIVIFCWLFGELCTILSQYMAYESLKRNASLEAKLRKFTQLELFALFEQHFFVPVAANWFAAPLSLHIASFIDQGVFLDSIRLNWYRFNARLRQTLDRRKSFGGKGLNGGGSGNRWSITAHDKIGVRAIASFSVPLRISWNKPPEACGRTNRRFGETDEHFSSSSSSSSWTTSSGLGRRRSYQSAKFDCDREALELYLQLRVFIGQSRESQQLIQFVMNLNICFLAVVMFPTLFYARSLNLDDHLSLFLVWGFMVIGMIDGMFCICASFKANCARTLQLTWSLIAHSFQTVGLLPQSEPRLPHLRMPPDRLIRRRARTGMNWTGLEPSIALVASSNLADISGCLVPHTLHLWRRLIERQDKVLDQLTCRLFGIMRLDYDSILRLNYWLASITILFLRGETLYYGSSAPRTPLVEVNGDRGGTVVT